MRNEKKSSFTVKFSLLIFQNLNHYLTLHDYNNLIDNKQPKKA